jgi:predicted Zn-dependent peptidase
MPARHGGAGIDLLGDVLARSTLDDDDVESERQVILEELAMDDDSPDDVALRTLTRQLFPDHGLGRDTAGDRDTVRSITADDIRRFHRDHYTTGSTVVAVAGEVEHDEIRDAVAAAFADLPEGDGRVPRHRPGDVGESFAIDDDSEQIHLAIGGRAVRRDDPDREVLDVVNHVFGGGLSSRLFDEIRERRGLAYSVYSATSSFADAGAWSVYAGAMPEHVGEVERLVHGEIERLVSGGISAEELDVAVGYLTGAYQLGLEDTAARMSRLGGMLTTLGKVHSVEEQLARWEQVSLEDAKRVIADVFGSAPPVTVTVGPSF